MCSIRLGAMPGSTAVFDPVILQQMERMAMHMVHAVVLRHHSAYMAHL
jgi:hypothetical protein